MGPPQRLKRCCQCGARPAVPDQGSSMPLKLVVIIHVALINYVLCSICALVLACIMTEQRARCCETMVLVEWGVGLLSSIVLTPGRGGAWRDCQTLALDGHHFDPRQTSSNS